MYEQDYLMEKPWLKSYPPRAQEDPEIPDVPLYEMVDQTVEEHPDRTALVFLGREMTYGEMGEKIDRLADALDKHGVEKGDTVGIFLPNSIQFVLAYYASLKTGATVTTMNPLYTGREAKRQLIDSEADVLFCLDVFYEKVADLVDENHLETVVVTNIADFMSSVKSFFGKLLGRIPSADVPSREEVLDFRDLMNSGEPSPPDVDLDPSQDLASLSYTGGTTAQPKGVMLTHRNLVANSTTCTSFLEIEEAEEVFLGLLPFYHIYGQTTIMTVGLSRAAEIVIFPRLELDDLIEAIPEREISVFFGVPTLYNLLLDSEEFQDLDLFSLKYCISGADILHEETIREFHELTGIWITEGYGLTETSPVTHINPPDAVRPGSFGIPIPGTTAGVMAFEGGEFLPPGEVGEIAINGPQVMKGYWKDDKLTEKALVEIDGTTWFRTGDAGRMDEDGYFYFVERRKDMIKHKAYSVFPREIEEVLYSHPEIKEAGVIGVPDENVGERVKAFLVLKDDEEIDDEGLTDYCAERLAEYKVPESYEIVDEIPKGPVGKVIRRELREGQ